MNKIFLSFLVSMAIFSPVAVYADAKPYVALKFNYSSADTGNNIPSMSGVGGLAAFGFFQANGPIGTRTELEVGYSNLSRSENGVDYDFSPLTVMANFYTDLGQRDWFILPYFGFGFGFVRTVSNATAVGNSYEYKSNGIGWSFNAGASIKITANVKADLGFRYMRQSAFGKMSDNLSGMFGIRYSF